MNKNLYIWGIWQGEEKTYAFNVPDITRCYFWTKRNKEGDCDSEKHSKQVVR